MLHWKRLGSLLVCVGGMLGLALCVAGIVVAWSIASRLDAINQLAHNGIDNSAAAVHRRVLDAQTRVAESKLTSESVRQGLADWARKAAADHAAHKLDVQAKADRLASGLAQIDRHLEIAASTVESIQRTAELAARFGVRTETASVDPLHERLAAMRAQLDQASTALAEVRRRVADVAESGPLGERWHQVIQLALRIVATVGELDDHLGDAAARLVATQTWAQESKSTVRAWIVVGQSTATLLLAWFALGQASLTLYAWRTFRQRATDDP